MADLSTTYLGLPLRSPLVASSSPLTRDIASLRKMVEGGVGAVVMPSLFEEEIVHDEIELNRSLEAGTEEFAEALSYFPDVEELLDPADRYLADLEAIREEIDVPVVASLNASHTGAWTRYARLLEDAGADAIELNLFHVAADPRRTAADNEAADLEIVAAVRAATEVPLAVKLGPYYSAFANFAERVLEAGADGLVLFNRFYQPDLDLEELEVVPRIELSTQWEMRLPLRWIAILAPLVGSRASLAATSGISEGTDVVKALMAGATVAMTTSALLRHGAGHVASLMADLEAWLVEHEYESVDELRGAASETNVADPTVFARANYLRTLHSWSAPTS